MGKRKAKSFKPQGKDKLRKPKNPSSKISKKSNNDGIVHGRVESAKTERKVCPLSSTLTFRDSNDLPT
jgi:hypothetical protein